MTIDCAAARELLAEYAAGSLDGRDRGAIESHVQTCAECRAEADTFVEVADRVLALAPSAEPPVGFEASVIDRLAAPKRLHRRRGVVGLAAAAAIVLMLGLLLGRASAPTTDLHPVALTARGAYVGKAWVHGGTPGWIYVDMHSDETYPRVTLEVIDATGEVSTVGQLALRNGHGTLGARSPVPVSAVRTIRMVEPDGAIICQGKVS
jgi:hypothetical protein